MNTLVQIPIADTSLESPQRVGEKAEMKEVHFFTDYHESLIWMADHKYLFKGISGDKVLEELIDYKDTYNALQNLNDLFKKDEMHFSKVYVTTQMCFIDTEWFDYGFRIFVHDNTGTFEIKLGPGNERTHRYIRMMHNLFRMWKNGEFSP